MNKQEILDEINKTKEHLINMEKMLEECEYERWKPVDGDIYYYISEACTVIKSRTWAHCIVDEHYHCFNCFRTEEEAQAEAEKILVRRMLEDIAKRLNKGKKIDWDNEAQNKYFIRFDSWQDIIRLETCWKSKFQGVIYCLDEKFLDVANQEIGEERLEKYLEVNNER